jgi:hypothetical protein
VRSPAAGIGARAWNHEQREVDAEGKPLFAHGLYPQSVSTSGSTGLTGPTNQMTSVIDAGTPIPTSFVDEGTAVVGGPPTVVSLHIPTLPQSPTLLNLAARLERASPESIARLESGWATPTSPSRLAGATAALMSGAVQSTGRSIPLRPASGGRPTQVSRTGHPLRVAQVTLGPKVAAPPAGSPAVMVSGIPGSSVHAYQHVHTHVPVPVQGRADGGKVSAVSQRPWRPSGPSANSPPRPGGQELLSIPVKTYSKSQPDDTADLQLPPGPMYVAKRFVHISIVIATHVMRCVQRWLSLSSQQY